MNRKTLRFQCLYGILGTVLLTAVGVLTYVNHFVAGFAGMLGAAALYFTMVLTSDNRDYLELRAVFTAVWIFTISLSQLRLLGYQELWQPMTWVCLTLAYAAFQAGGILSGPLLDMLSRKVTKRRVFMNRVKLEFSKNKMVVFCFVGTLIGMACFAANIAIRGYVPFFSASTTAYTDFYTRFYVICVASTMLAGPCYYCAKVYKLKTWVKVLLYVCMLYNVFAFPILAVSRGTFITAAISLSCAIYYLNKRQLKVLIVCLIVMFGVYMLCSTARNYSDAQLDSFFEPVEIPVESPGEGEDDSSFQLSGKAAFLYGYLTVSHDNLNEAVQNCTQYSWGLRQIEPFNVILRLPQIEAALENQEIFLVRRHLNSVHLVGFVYYDFGWIGMILMPFLWALAFGLMQGMYYRRETAYMQLALGNTISVVALSFFSAWMSLFSTWMHWGVALLLMLFCSISFIRKNKN